MVWAARGTSFRQHGGGEAYERPGWFFNLEGPYPLDEPVTLTWLRSHEDQVRAVRASLAATYPGTLYFPFAVSDRRPLRAAQTYMAKFPSGLVSRVPALAAVGREATATHPTGAPPRLRAPGRTDATPGTDYREADEDATTAGRDPFEVDPTLVDRALRGHATTQNALANLLRSRGLAPRSPYRANRSSISLGAMDNRCLSLRSRALPSATKNSSSALGLGKYSAMATCSPTATTWW
jgi:hypothetical protein